MFNKKIKIEVPITKECSRCKDSAKVNDLRLTQDNVLVVSYMCDCGNEDVEIQSVKFI